VSSSRPRDHLSIRSFERIFSSSILLARDTKLRGKPEIDSVNSHFTDDTEVGLFQVRNQMLLEKIIQTT